MLETTLGCLKWAAVGFVVAFALMKLFEASFQDPADEARHLCLIDIRSDAFSFGLVARAKVGLS
jgi:hypothetical protein